MPIHPQRNLGSCAKVQSWPCNHASRGRPKEKYNKKLKCCSWRRCIEVLLCTLLCLSSQATFQDWPDFAAGVENQKHITTWQDVFCRKLLHMAGRQRPTLTLGSKIVTKVYIYMSLSVILVKPGSRTTYSTHSQARSKPPRRATPTPAHKMAVGEPPKPQRAFARPPSQTCGSRFRAPSTAGICWGSCTVWHTRTLGCTENNGENKTNQTNTATNVRLISEQSIFYPVLLKTHEFERSHWQ